MRRARRRKTKAALRRRSRRAYVRSRVCRIKSVSAIKRRLGCGGRKRRRASRRYKSGLYRRIRRAGRRKAYGGRLGTGHEGLMGLEGHSGSRYIPSGAGSFRTNPGRRHRRKSRFNPAGAVSAFKENFSLGKIKGVVPILGGMIANSYARAFAGNYLPSILQGKWAGMGVGLATAGLTGAAVNAVKPGLGTSVALGGIVQVMTELFGSFFGGGSRSSDDAAVAAILAAQAGARNPSMAGVWAPNDDEITDSFNGQEFMSSGVESDFFNDSAEPTSDGSTLQGFRQVGRARSV